jgi:hypothetical protein
MRLDCRVEEESGQLSAKSGQRSAISQLKYILKAEC